jgi:hypothetical protein
MPHKCPAPRCTVEVPDHMLMCRPHWYQVPVPLRTRVWATWRNGAGKGWADHSHAMQDAIDSLRGNDGDGS